MQMGSHIFDRQLRRSSVNARPRGATLWGLVVSVVFTNTCATSFPLCRFSVSKRFPRCPSTTVGLRPLSRDISSGFSDSLFFPSALFNSLVRRFGRSSGTYSLEAGPDGSGHRPQKHIPDFETDSLATRDSRVDRIRQFSYILCRVCLVSLEERLRSLKCNLRMPPVSYV